MLGLKDILTNCFRDQPINFAQAIEYVDDSHPEGVFTNPIVNEFTRRFRIPNEDMKNYILPSFKSTIHNLGNNLARLEMRHSLLSESGKNDSSIGSGS